jgi:hypothetical protein
MRRVVKGSSVAIEQSLRQFHEAFADEKSCAAYLFKMRWPDGLYVHAAVTVGPGR